ncbi:hypothetical protein AYI68_g2663 [Smittium mucronatum]|uniref:Uncharacterized protein n=1 Tax=Smittium mucronatum TaxID=133383 RepID=A0A1R0H226_9FUNG|nr:hypothetical protein AYI68_g2663 [Smittium mucronatum]
MANGCIRETMCFEDAPLILHVIKHHFLWLDNGYFPLFVSGATVVACRSSYWIIDNRRRSGYHIAFFHSSMTRIHVVYPIQSLISNAWSDSDHSVCAVILLGESAEFIVDGTYVTFGRVFDLRQ